MADLFLHGAMCDPPLLLAVLARDVQLRPATIYDHAVFRNETWPFGWLSPVPGASARGGILESATDEDLARLAFYHAVQGLHAGQGRARAGGDRPVRFWLPETPRSGGIAWDEALWRERWSEVVAATAGDVMALMGERPAAEVARRHFLMMVRGASRLRAVGSPAALRHPAQPGDAVVEARRQPYSNYFAVEEYDLRHRRFDRTMSGTIDRAVFISGDAVTVLPYDPVRDRVLLIEQFRAGPLARGDDQPWLLEAIAGRIDPGETPEEAARREAVEEAGLALGPMLPVAAYYPTPGAKSEFLYSYVALTDLPDGITGTYGMDEEAEDIRSHLVAFGDLMALLESGELANAQLVLTVLWLARERARLRG